MRIGVVQSRSSKGDVRSNIDHHKKLIALAVSAGADLVVFPELSLTGYEPPLANELAITEDDATLNDFQIVSDENSIFIGVGMPTRNDEGVCISMIIFQPRKPRRVYSKKYLHADEQEFFVAGKNFATIKMAEINVAFAICYEISVPEHQKEAFEGGANIYIASAAKSASGVQQAVETLSAIAGNYDMPVLFSNSIGYCDNFESAGSSSIWNQKGVLTGQLDDAHEGLLVFDLTTAEIVKMIL